jgi:cell division protein FtsB
MVAFALEGGEYGTRDLLALKRQIRDEQGRIAELRLELDALTRLGRALRTDPATQERYARELYGMLRPGERLYQVVPADSSR